jgi:uncharacterized membrane protein
MTRTERWCLALGFALGGLFDGILLHQILQWHHLLSLVPSVASLRAQVLWDGYFHAAMYLVAAVSIWGLWRTQDGPPASALLIGFGLWHVTDAVLSHWILGIHRVRLDSSDPLYWDLLWVAGFGVLPLAAGLSLRRRTKLSTRRGRARLVLIIVGLSTTGLASWSLRSPASQPFTTVVFAPGTTAADVVGAMRSADAQLVWSNPEMSVVVANVDAARRLGFYRRGAILVGGSGLAAGCLAWSRI